MIRKFVIIFLIFSLIITYVAPHVAYAGGSGGEPLMSDSVGWGIVGVMVIVGIYVVYMAKQETSSNKENSKDKAENVNRVKSDTSNIVTPYGDFIIAKW
jgi:uncharacterized membrane protein